MPSEELPLGVYSADKALAKGFNEYLAEQNRLLSIAKSVDEDSSLCLQKKEEELAGIETLLAETIKAEFNKEENIDA